MNEIELKMLDLLNTHPRAYSIIMEFFTRMMIDSFVNKSVPEEFKEEMKKLGLSKDRMAMIIGGAPRCLFDVFDENEIYIEIYRTQGESFTFNIDGLVEHPNHYQKRKDCELDAIIESFKLLEIKQVSLP